MHLRHILLAEFDIDEGSILRHQLPVIPDADQQLLAELMLPDGVHARSEDWTVFFLNHTAECRKETLHCLNLVRTKKDDRVRRGALVKALAICTTEPYIHVYKPLLLLTLEEYFSNPDTGVLEKLLVAVNHTDSMPLPSYNSFERSILRHSERKDLFEDRLTVTTNSTHSSPSTKRQSAESSSSKSSLARSPTKSASNKSAQMSGHVKDTHYSEIVAAFGKLHIPLRIPVYLEAEDVGDYSIISLIQCFTPQASHAFSTPFHPHLHTLGALTPPIILLLNALWTGKRIVFLGSAVPAGQVSQFVLAACAMANGGGSCTLAGFRERCFPYSNLINRDAHEAVSGYIAGVTNPRFEAFTSSWDVFCNIDAGRISVSKDLKASMFTNPSAAVSTEDIPISPTSAGSDETSIGLGAPPIMKADFRDASDFAFIDELTTAIAAHASEQTIRSKFAAYANRFLKMASKLEEDRSGLPVTGWPTMPFSVAQNTLGSGLVASFDTTREIGMHRPVIEAWMLTHSYALTRQRLKSLSTKTSIRHYDLAHQMSRLRLSRSVPLAEVELIYQTLMNTIQGDDQITELLSHTPAYSGGLLPLSLGLFHASQSVQRNTTELLLRVESHPVGSKLMADLNYFSRMALNSYTQE